MSSLSNMKVSPETTLLGEVAPKPDHLPSVSRRLNNSLIDIRGKRKIRKRFPAEVERIFFMPITNQNLSCYRSRSATHSSHVSSPNECARTPEGVTLGEDDVEDG
jgi:hypothetical protein